MNQVENSLDAVVQVLKKSHFDSAADELINLVNEAIQSDDSEEKTKIKKEIVDRTNVRWLGDLNVDMSSNEWWKLLEKLRKSVQKIN